MVDKLDDYLRFNQAALDLRAQRQQVLASNIANADTPNFKARDIDFAKTLEEKLGRRQTPVKPLPGLPPVELARTSPGHIAGSPIQPDRGLDDSQLLYRPVTQGSVDGNTVDMDVERNQFTDNGVHYEAGVTAINAQIKLLLSAIQPG